MIHEALRACSGHLSAHSLSKAVGEEPDVEEEPDSEEPIVEATVERCFSNASLGHLSLGVEDGGSERNTIMVSNRNQRTTA